MTSPQQPTQEARYTVSPLDWRLLLSSLIHFGKSADGCLERDLTASIENALTAATDKARREHPVVGFLRKKQGEGYVRVVISEALRALTPQNPGDAEAQEG